MTCKATPELKNESVGRLPPQLRLSWAGAGGAPSKRKVFPLPARKQKSFQACCSHEQHCATYRCWGAGSQDAFEIVWGNLATRATMIFRKILYRQGSRWASAIEDPLHGTSTKSPNFASSLAPRAWPRSNLQNQHLWRQKGHSIWCWQLGAPTHMHEHGWLGSARAPLWAVPHRGWEFHTLGLVATGDGRLPPNIFFKDIFFLEGISFGRSASCWARFGSSTVLLLPGITIGIISISYLTVSLPCFAKQWTIFKEAAFAIACWKERKTLRSSAGTMSWLQATSKDRWPGAGKPRVSKL